MSTDHVEPPGTTMAGASAPSPGSVKPVAARWPGVSAVRVPDLTALAARALPVAVELSIIVVWACLVMRPLWNLDPYVYPGGNEAIGSLQTHHMWTRVRQCGLCGLWDGSPEGGNPALGDPAGEVLNPFVVVTTLLWGVVNGGKLMAIAGVVGIGLGQWWLARTLGVGLVPRLWSAGLAVVGGHVGARLAMGPSMPAQVALCALVFPAAIAFHQKPTRRRAALFGLVLGLAALGGPTYTAIAMVYVLPLVVVLIPWHRTVALLVARRYAITAVIAALLAAPLYVPLLSFMPEIVKTSDPALKGSQPLAYVPLNLVINDLAFYTSDALGKVQFVSHNANYIGWIPVLLAVWGAVSPATGRRREILFLLSSTFLLFWVASGAPQRFLAGISPDAGLRQTIGGIRFTSFHAVLAIPPILGLAALGLDRILNSGWRSLRLSISTGEGGTTHSVPIDGRLVLIVPLAFAIQDAYAFNSRWIALSPGNPDVPNVIAALRTPDLQWVATPLTEGFFLEPAVAAGLKLSVNPYRTWQWRTHPRPEPALAAARVDSMEGMGHIGTVGPYHLFAGPPGREYAAVVSESGARTRCAANGVGGHINVACLVSEPGILTVAENSVSGWEAWVGEARAPLLEGARLAVAVPAGESVIRFRYRPVEVPVGLVLGCLGALLAGYFVWKGAAAPEEDGAPGPAAPA